MLEALLLLIEELKTCKDQQDAKDKVITVTALITAVITDTIAALADKFTDGFAAYGPLSRAAS